LTFYEKGKQPLNEKRMKINKMYAFLFKKKTTTKFVLI